MKKKLCLLVTILFVLLNVYGQNQDKIVTSRIDTVENNRLILVQEFIVNSPIEKVWAAYTTRSGWEGWAVPLAEIDWRIGGTIKTNYNPDGIIGDSSTIVIHVVNFIPLHMITLQAEITDNFPDFMKADEKELYNIIEFHSIDKEKTKVVSFGIGYKNNEKYQNLMGYFIQANEQTSLKLISYLEKNN